MTWTGQVYSLQGDIELVVQKDDPNFGIQDLKAHFRGSKYVSETLKLLPQKPDQILIQQIFNRITKIGSINGG